MITIKKHHYLVGYLEEIKLYGQGVSAGNSTEGYISHCLSVRFSSRPIAWSVEGVNTLAAVRIVYYNKIDVFEIRKRNPKKHTKNDKYYESLQTRVLTSNSRLNKAIVSVGKNKKYKNLQTLSYQR